MGNIQTTGEKYDQNHKGHVARGRACLSRSVRRIRTVRSHCALSLKTRMGYRTSAHGAAPMKRKEIPKRVKLDVFVRAGGPENLRCERCCLPIGGKRFDYHHEIPEWVQNVPPSERSPITPDDVKLLGYECCHKQISAEDQKRMYHGKRIVAKAARAEKKYSRPIPGSRNSKFKKRIDGTVILR